MNAIKTYYNSLDIYKKAIWLYIILIFLQEVMRKWFMPGASSLWMISREPIVIWFVFIAMQKHWIQHKVAFSFMIVACIALIFTMTFGHGDFPVAIWGFRIWFFHFPFIFAAAHILNKRDLMWIIRFLLLIFIISFPLHVMQFFAPPGSKLLASSGGGIADASIAVNGAVRPSGLFSHSMGASYFNPILVSIILAAFFSMRYRHLFSSPKYFWTLFGCMIIMLVTSVSRGFIFQSALIFFFVLIFIQAFGRMKKFKNIFLITTIIIAAIIVLQSTSFGQQLLEPLTRRFENASDAEGGTEGVIESRMIYPYLWFAPPNTTSLSWSLTPFGYGLGLSSNFASQTLSGSYGFILGEYSSQQVTGEMGFLLGTIVFFSRVGYIIYLFPKCIRALKLRQDPLPLCLWPLAMQEYGNGSVNLIFCLGPITLCMILMLVALKPDPILQKRQMNQVAQEHNHKFRPFELNRLTGIRSSGDRK